MRSRFAIVACILVTATGCAAAALKHQAALDHGCSEDRIAIVHAATEAGLPSEVDVCGKIRRYRMVSTNENGVPVWLDVTDLVPGSSSAPRTK